MNRKDIHLLDAGGDHCRYPMWDDKSKATLRVCGKPGYPWCPEHHALVFQKRKEREDSLVIPCA